MPSTKPIEDNDNAKEFWENLADATELEESTKTALRGKIGAGLAEEGYRYAVWTNDWINVGLYATVTSKIRPTGLLSTLVELNVADDLICPPIAVPNGVQDLTFDNIFGEILTYPLFTNGTQITQIEYYGNVYTEGTGAYERLLAFLQNLEEVTPTDSVPRSLTIIGDSDPLWNSSQLTALRGVIANLTALGWIVEIPNFIRGTAFPGETLTADFVGQWQVGGINVGSPQLSYTVTVDDIGKIIGVKGAASSVTVWQPSNISAVQEFYWARANVFNSISPNVPATNGQTVRRWGSFIGSSTADQTTSTFQPIYRSAGQSGGPSLEFDGTNDSLNLLASRFANVSQAYIIVGCRDTQPAGALPTHVPVRYSVGTSTASRLAISTRNGSANTMNIAARRVDGGALASVDSTGNSNYRVLRAHGDYSNGVVRAAINGTSIGSAALSSGSGNTSSTNSQLAHIGGFDGVSNGSFIGHVTCIFICAGSMSATEVSQLERFAGLHGGLNIPLV